MENTHILQQLNDELNKFKESLNDLPTLRNEFNELQSTVKSTQNNLLEDLKKANTNVEEMIKKANDSDNEVLALKKSFTQLRDSVINTKQDSKTRAKNYLSSIIANAITEGLKNTQIPNLANESLFVQAKNYLDTDVAKENIKVFRNIKSAQNPLEPTELIRESFSDDIIQLLYPEAILRTLPVTNITLVNGNFTYPVQSTASTGYTYKGHGEVTAEVTAPTVNDRVKLSTKTLGAKILLNRDMLRWTFVDFTRFVLNELQTQMQIEFDSQAFYGSGTQDKMKGIFLNPYRSFDASTDEDEEITLHTIHKDFMKIKAQVAEDNKRINGSRGLTLLMNPVLFYSIGAFLNAEGSHPAFISALFTNSKFYDTPIRTGDLFNKSIVHALVANDVVIGDDYMFETIWDEYTQADKREIRLLAYSGHDVALLRPTAAMEIVGYNDLNILED